VSNSEIKSLTGKGELITMKKFEYKCVPILKMGKGTTRELNEYGTDGWELVCVWAFWHYLKREVE
jgi:hypothetical protein